MPPDENDEEKEPCPECDGSGEVEAEYATCPCALCNGTGELEDDDD